MRWRGQPPCAATHARILPVAHTRARIWCQATRSDEAQDQATKARAEVTRRIMALGRQGKPKAAISELTNMARMGIQPDTQAATALISACIMNNNVELACTVFEELFVDVVPPDDVVFSILIRGIGSQSDPPDWAAIARWLTRMHVEFKVPTTLAVYNALLELCANTNDLARAEDIMEKMANQGIRPDDITRRTVEGKRALRSAMKRVFGAP